MALTGPCLRLVMLLLTLLGAHGENSGAVFRVVPTKLQFSEYELVSFHCEGLDVSVLRGIRNTEDFLSVCDKRMSVLSCNISRAYRTDSGEYWCETERGERSQSVSITVTAGSVILESPVLPVTVGHNVTLRCRNKWNSSHLLTNFYKDGHFMWSSPAGEMTIRSVSKSDEGLYKCSISGTGDSAQSRLSVIALHRETCPCSDHFLNAFAILRTLFTIVLLTLLLLLVGLLHYEKLKLVPNYHNYDYTFKVDWPFGIMK